MPSALYYIHDPFAPQPNCPTRFGSAVVIEAKGKILLEHRKDNFRWGIVTGDLRDTETFKECGIRRTIEETGIHLPFSAVEPLKMFDDPSRIVSYLEGNVYRIVHQAYDARLDSIPNTVCGQACIELRWVEPKELEHYSIVVTHQEILERYFRKYGIEHTMRMEIREK